MAVLGREVEDMGVVMSLWAYQHAPSCLEVLKIVFIFVLGPLSPGGSRGRVRSVIFLRKSSVLGRFRLESEDF